MKGNLQRNAAVLQYCAASSFICQASALCNQITIRASRIDVLCNGDATKRLAQPQTLRFVVFFWPRAPADLPPSRTPLWAASSARQIRRNYRVTLGA